MRQTEGNYITDKDCIADVRFDNGKLEIITDVLKIAVEGKKGFFQSNGRKWQFVQPEQIIDVKVSYKNNRGNTDCCVVELFYEKGIEKWYLYPHLQFLCTERHLDERTFILESPHIQITTVEMVDKTDFNDSLVNESVHQYYRCHKSTGNMFMLEDYAADSGLLLVKHSPCPGSAVRRAPDGDLYVDDNIINLRGCGYGAAYGVGIPSELFDGYKRLYANLCEQQDLNFIMSNTWGDRSCDGAMKEEFVLREIECAHHLGVDIVQLDDGWQKGISSCSVYAAENNGGAFEGFRDFDPDFWLINPVKFPGGMEKILQKARQLGIEIGLWFAPDSSADFENWEKDVEAIRTFAEEYGARHIKLDSVVIISEECEKNYMAMLDAISRIRCHNGEPLRFNLDITADERLGYFCGISYGTLFVENRYTDLKNYYPHRTMRNLWQLSKYIPTTKFQFEVLNLRRNAEKYGDDPLAPATYDIDWCFASVMASNPLIWMEMQHLNEKDTEALRSIISVYLEHRKEMSEMSVSPIGDLPNGVGWSGFHWQGNKEGYITFFRGITDEEKYMFKLPVKGIDCMVLHGNTETEINETEHGLNVTLGKKRGYVFVKYKISFKKV